MPRAFDQHEHEKKNPICFLQTNSKVWIFLPKYVDVYQMGLIDEKVFLFNLETKFSLSRKVIERVPGTNKFSTLEILTIRWKVRPNLKL